MCLVDTVCQCNELHGWNYANMIGYVRKNVFIHVRGAINDVVCFNRRKYVERPAEVVTLSRV